MLNAILESVLWSPKVRSGVVCVPPGTPTTVVANLIARAIIELAELQKPCGWEAEETTVRASYDKQSGFIEVSLTR